MEENPKIDIQQYQTSKIKYWYLIKFAIYIVVLLGLLFWYNHQQSKPSKQIVEPNELQFEDVQIEP
jgi:uncharacterized membrane protein (DUF373 family)